MQESDNARGVGTEGGRSAPPGHAGDAPSPTSAQIAAFARGEAIDPRLRREIEADPLLLADVSEIQANDRFIEELLDLGTGSVRPEVGAPDGLSIPGYELLSRVASGGQAVVYRARQISTGREVALKVLLDGAAASPSRRRRFLREIEVVAALQHPGIVVVFDSGETADGRMYFTMEYVDGEPITTWARERELSTTGRLELVRDIAVAVQYAHGRGVIHRDLKPANVLADGRGHPRVLDFGIAGVLDREERLTTIETSVGQLLGTLPYMSPEQIGGRTEEVDVRSDVYALGVLAYELLAGHPPLDLSSAPLAEAVRVVQEVEPVRLGRLDPRWRGDIETIVARALEKDADRRYQTAAEFAADIERHLDDQPIVAHPPSLLYQFRKFSRRNRGLVVGSSLAAAAVVGGLVATTTLSLQLASALGESEERRIAAVDATERANAATDRAVRSTNTMAATQSIIQAIFGFATGEGTGVATPLPEAVRLAGASPERLLQEADLEDRIGEDEAVALVYAVLTRFSRGLDDWDQVERFATLAIEAWDDVPAADPTPRIDAHVDRAIARRRAGDFDAAREDFDAAADISEAIDDAPRAAGIRILLGDTDTFEARTADGPAADRLRTSARAIARDVEAAAIARIADPALDEDERVAWLSVAIEAAENSAYTFAFSAEPDFPAALAELDRGIGYVSPPRPKTLELWATMNSNKSILLRSLDDRDGAIELLRTVLQAERDTGQTRTRRLITAADLAVLLLSAGAFDEALSLGLETWEEARDYLAPTDLAWRNARRAIGVIEARTGGLDRGIRHLAAFEAELSRTSQYEEDRRRARSARALLARLEARAGRFSDASARFAAIESTATRPSRRMARDAARTDLRGPAASERLPARLEMAAQATDPVGRLAAVTLRAADETRRGPGDRRDQAVLDLGDRLADPAIGDALEADRPAPALAAAMHDAALIQWVAGRNDAAGATLDRLAAIRATLDPWTITHAQATVLLARAHATGLRPFAGDDAPLAADALGQALATFRRSLGETHPVRRTAEALASQLDAGSPVDAPSIAELSVPSL